MLMTPELTRIDLMLSEYRAACYSASMGKLTFAELDEMQRQIVKAVADLTNSTK